MYYHIWSLALSVQKWNLTPHLQFFFIFWIYSKGKTYFMTFKVSYQKADDLKMIPSCLNEEIFCSQVDKKYVNVYDGHFDACLFIIIKCHFDVISKWNFIEIYTSKFHFCTTANLCSIGKIYITDTSNSINDLQIQTIFRYILIYVWIK